jgi:hypothetical protein
MSQPKEKMTGTWTIEGVATKLVQEQIDLKKREGVKIYGKNAAIQALLNELYFLKHSSQLGA